MTEPTIRYATCPLCEATCGIRLELEGGRIAAVRGDDKDPFSRGHICPKAPALKDLQEDPDRLRRPMVREGDTWHEVDWETALDAAAAGLHRVREEHGSNALGVYLGNPTVHNTGAMLTGPLLVKALKTKNRFSATSVDQLPHMFAAYQMWAHQLLIPIPDIDHTDCFVILGGNPLASNGSLMTVPDVKNRLKAIRARGGEVIVVDPRRTETAAMADRHHFIRPGTDALLLLALVHEVLAAGDLPDTPPLSYSRGLDTLAKVAADYPAERVAPVTGIDAEAIRTLARTLRERETAAVYGRMGASTQPFGALCHWLINALNVLTGNFDRRGGVLFTRPAVDGIAAAGPFGIGRGSFGRWRSRVRGLPEFGGELPVAVLGEEMLTPGDGQIRGMLTSAGNPVLSTPNGGQLDRAFAGLDFYVAIDFYLNETTRHADVILPPVGPMERDHYDLAFHMLAVRNTAKYVPAPLEPPADGRSDFEINLALLGRLTALAKGGRLPLAQRLTLAAMRWLGPGGMVDLALRMGPYGSGFRPGNKGLNRKRLMRHPHGIDLGPLAPSLPGRLPDGVIELAPDAMIGDLPRLERRFFGGRDDAAAGAGDQLLLIGRRHVRDNNSWMHNAPSLMTGRPRHGLMIHPDDAAARGLADGATARVRSRTGEITVAVAVSDEVMPGVVSLPHGYGHGRGGTRLTEAARHAGASINDLTDDAAIDELCGNAAFSSTPVEVTA